MEQESEKMDAELPSRRLTTQHRRIDTGIQGILDGSGKRAALAESLALLRLHLYVEEELLFPPLAKSGLMMPLFVMKREHGQMWPLLQTLTAGATSETALETLLDPAGELFQLLQIHNQKEEQIVYTAADHLVAGQAGDSLMETLEARQIPEGWICEKAPH